MEIQLIASRIYQGFKKKREKTNLQKYGCKNPSQSETIKHKIISSNIEKYGVPYSTQSDEVKKKRVLTCLEKYGETHYSKTEEYRNRFSKERSPCWKGGTKLGRDRASLEYREWRRQVFERDHYTCKCCGDHSEKGHKVELHAHHILNWSNHQEKRYDVSNGITLCDKCHYEFHSIYGKHNNCSEQIEAFIELKRYAELERTESQEPQDKKFAG